MTPAARIATAAELLESLMRAWQAARPAPADKLIDQYFRERRFIGSKDRGAVAELVYWILRYKASLEWWAERFHMPLFARTLVLAALVFRQDVTVAQLATLFDGSKYAPAPLTDGEWQFVHHLARQPLAHADMPSWVRLNYPAWLEPRINAAFGKRAEAEMAALLEQAPVDLRTNTLNTSRDDLLQKLGSEQFDATPTAMSPVGIRLKKREAIFASPAFRQGLFEMQDEGSQVVSLLVDAQPGQKVIDFCAGAGGKTLAIAAQMQNKGRILAWDTSAKRLAQLPMRLKRAGVYNTEWRVISSEHDAYIKRHKLAADRVLVDAPCSGTGTWRRNPDLKWRFSEKDLNELIDVQARILDSAARLVKPGGRMIYATCSLLPEENEQQIDKFLKTRSNFTVVCAQKVWNKLSSAEETSGNDAISFLWLTPHQDGVDGFFAAVLERTSA